MIDYTYSLLWLLSWPAVIFLAYKFIRLNIRQLERMERLIIAEKELEKEGRMDIIEQEFKREENL